MCAKFQLPLLCFAYWTLGICVSISWVYGSASTGCCSTSSHDCSLFWHFAVSSQVYVWVRRWAVLNWLGHHMYVIDLNYSSARWWHCQRSGLRFVTSLQLLESNLQLKLLHVSEFRSIWSAAFLANVLCLVLFWHSAKQHVVGGLGRLELLSLYPMYLLQTLPNWHREE